MPNWSTEAASGLAACSGSADEIEPAQTRAQAANHLKDSQPMELLYTEVREHSAFADGLQHLRRSFPKSRPCETDPAHANNVIITSKFLRRKARPENLAGELAALKHLTSFLSADASTMVEQLATALKEVCDAGSAGVTLEERRRTTTDLQCVAAAGQLVSRRLGWGSRNSPCGTVIDVSRPELFSRPKAFFPEMRNVSAEIQELLIAPWELSSGRRGVIWLAHHDPHRHFDPEDLRLMTSLGDFATRALQRSHSEETSRSCGALAAAGRVANQLAHEINNPLQALINSLYLVSPAQHDENLLEAQTQAERVARLVRSILELKREAEPARGKKD